MSKISNGIGLSGHLVVTNEKLKADPLPTINTMSSLISTLGSKRYDRVTVVRILGKLRAALEEVEDIYELEGQ